MSARQSALLSKSGAVGLFVGISGPPYKSGTTSPQLSNATATAGGGTPPYSYAWTKVSGDASVAISSGAALATVTLTSGGMLTGDYKTGTFRCTVTDAVLATTSSDCFAEFERTP